MRLLMHASNRVSLAAFVSQSKSTEFVARRPLSGHKVNLLNCVARRPLCHKVNLPRCEARRRHLIMTCDIFGTGQTNTLTLCYLLKKITGKVIDVSRTHVPLKALTGLVRSLNSDAKAFKTVNSM